MAKKHKSKTQKKPSPKPKPKPLTLDQQVADYRSLGKPFARRVPFNPFGGRR